MTKSKILKKVIPILVALLMLTPASCSSDNSAGGVGEKSVMAEYKKTVEDSDYILHALGGMDETDDYINSIECLEAGYQKGCRLFEADVSFTSDKVLVLAHSGEDNIWSENDWKLRLCQVYPFDNESEEELKAKGYDIEKHLCTYEEFMSFRIQGWYKTASFSDLLDYMEQHKDIYVMVDGGHRSYEDTLEFYKAIKETAGDRTDVLDRLIAGGQTTDMVKAAREVYDFPLINLFFDSDEKREDALKTPEDFAKYCRENGISSFSAAKETFDGKNASLLEDDSLISYIFTVNDEEEEAKLRKAGADVIGTDFLWDK
ncbi:MAG: hypothetical protein J5517_11225 [Eubacterium sp.]|nr:hypothetical protein [Eubacterium sp.]